jgi:hypothetical protein
VGSDGEGWKRGSDARGWRGGNDGEVGLEGSLSRILLLFPFFFGIVLIEILEA